MGSSPAISHHQKIPKRKRRRCNIPVTIWLDSGLYDSLIEMEEKSGLGRSDAIRTAISVLCDIVREQELGNRKNRTYIIGRSGFYYTPGLELSEEETGSELTRNMEKAKREQKNPKQHNWPANPVPTQPPIRSRKARAKTPTFADIQAWHRKHQKAPRNVR